MADYELKWYRDHVKVTLNEATEEVLKALAYRITERTQLNIRDMNLIDTGFMVNSIYPVWTDGSEYQQARQAAEEQTTGRDGRKVDHSGDMAPEVSLERGAGAAVVVGANYAIYQEVKHSFLYNAAEAAAREFGGEAEQVYRQVLPDEGPGAK